MKHILLSIILLIFSEGLYAQKDVTKFLNIPVDGSKTAMTQKLKAKGFQYNSTLNCFKNNAFHPEYVDGFTYKNIKY